AEVLVSTYASYPRPLSAPRASPLDYGRAIVPSPFPGGVHVSFTVPHLAGPCPRAVRRRRDVVPRVGADRPVVGRGARRSRSGGPELRSRRTLDVREGREAGARHLRHAALDADT